MKIAYNPLGSGALPKAPDNKDITFDLVGKVIYALGVPFDGKDTKYTVFKKHTSSDNKGGSEGLVPIPSYSTTNTRLLREDGLWVNVTGITPPDAELSTESTNAVQNKVITNKINEILASIQLKAADVYKNIKVGNTTLVASGINDTLEFKLGNGIIITPNATNKTLEFSINATGNLGINTSYNNNQLVVKILDEYYNKWNAVYNWYISVTEEDTDNLINKWLEIVDFLNSIAEGTDILDEFVTRKTDLTIIGGKTFSKQIVSSVAQGTAPFSVASTTVVSKLNADLLDDYNASGLFTNLSNDTNLLSVTIGGTNKKLTIDYANTAGRLEGGSIATWGTLTSANGYTNVATYDYGGTKGAFSFAGKGGQLSLQLDGFFYQNEGKFLVLDTNNYSTHLDNRYYTETEINNKLKEYLPLIGGTMTGPITMGTNNYIYGINESTGAMLFFDGSKTVIGSNGSSTTAGTHIRSKNCVVTVGTGNSASYTMIHSGNYTDYTVKKDGTGATGTWGISITGNAHSVDNYHVATTGTNKPWGMLVSIGSDGVSEMGRYIDFHYDNTTGSDYSTRLLCTGNHSNIVNLPNASGTLALASQIPSVTGYYWADQSITSAKKADTTPTFYTTRIQGSNPALYIRNTNTAVDTYSIIRFGNSDGDDKAYIFLNGPNRTNDGGKNMMTIRNNVGDLRLNNYTTVTGGQSLYGLTSTCNAGNEASYTKAAVQIREYNFGGAQSDTWAIAPRLAWHWSGRVLILIGLGSNNELYVSKDLFANAYKLWHGGNDGSGSGLDADLLDGLHAHSGRNNEANKVVRTDANGYILAGWINTTSGDMGTTGITRIYCSDDGYIRYKTPANFFNILANDGNQISITVGSQNRKLTVNYASTSGKVIINLHTSNNTEYPIVWTNSNNTTNAVAADLFKSYSHLTYNPNGQRITVGLYRATTGHFSSDTTLYVNSASACSIIFRIGGAEKARFALPNGYLGILTSSPSYPLHVTGDSYTTGWSRAGNGFYVEGRGVHYMSNNVNGIGQIYLSNNEFNWSASTATLYFNYRAGANGTTVTSYVWNAGSSSNYASHTLGNLTTRGTIFVNTGDATLKIYSGRITDAKSDGNICLQTCIDGLDGQTHSYAPDYQARENLVLQPRGGQVYIGTNPDGGNTSYKLYVNGGIFSTGFTKSGSSDSYALLGGGGHKQINNVLNTAFYKRVTTVNGSGWNMAGTDNSAAFTIFAPTTAGTSNYILQSNGSGAPTWIALSSITAGSANWLNVNSTLTYGASGLNYFNISGTAGNTKANNTPTSAWYHVLRMNHGNSGGYLADIAVPLNDVGGVWWRQIRNGAFYGWYKLLDNNNSAVSGGGSSGGSSITVNLGGTSKTLTIPTSLPANGGTSSNVVVNYSDANSTYRMVWHSGNTLYGTNNIYCNPSADLIYSAGFKHVSYNSASYLLRSDGGAAGFHWSGLGGQPTWLWGGNSQHTYYVYNPSNFNVNSAAKLRVVSCYNGTTNNDLWSTIKSSNSSYLGTSTMYEVYNDGGPTTYGHILDTVTVHNNHWQSQLWMAAGKDGRLYYRNKDYNNDTWGNWGTVAWTSDIPTVTNYYWANVKVSASSSTGTTPTFSTCYTSNWFRSTGTTGWYSESYGGGWFMLDTTYVRTYNSKAVYVSNTGDHAIYTAGGFASAKTNGSVFATYYNGTWYCDTLYTHGNGNLSISPPGGSLYLAYNRGNIYFGGGTYYINRSGYFNGTAAAADSVAWANVTGKPTIPSVGNGTVTIKLAGVSKGSFTMNQSGNTTIELTDTNTDTNTWRPIYWAKYSVVFNSSTKTITKIAGNHDFFKNYNSMIIPGTGGPGKGHPANFPSGYNINNTIISITRVSNASTSSELYYTIPTVYMSNEYLIVQSNNNGTFHLNLICIG